jgi:hypothetical protein
MKKTKTTGETAYSQGKKTKTTARHIIRFPGRVKKRDVSRETSRLKKSPRMFHVKHWGKGVDNRGKAGGGVWICGQSSGQPVRWM